MRKTKELKKYKEIVAKEIQRDSEGGKKKIPGIYSQNYEDR